MTNPIPVARLGRLAGDRFPRGQRIGGALFRDDAKRILHAADTLGIRDMIVHAISEDARVFYLALGFASSPLAR
jgi:GNAT superfamily N-acetyltransferase